MKNNILFFLLIMIVTVSCKEKKTEFFSGNINNFEFSGKIDTIKGSKVMLEGVYTGYMSVYDSLILFNSYKYSVQHLSIFSLNSGEHLVSICDKGQGPEEFKDFGHKGQFLIENNEIKLWGYDHYKKSILINITKSIKNQTTEIDSVININWFREQTMPWNVFFLSDNGKFIMKSQPTNKYLNSGNRGSYTYHIYQDTFDNEVESYALYKNTFDNDQDRFQSDMTFSSFDGIHPTNNNKIAMAMLGVPQINILNILTGELKGVRINSFDIDKLIHFQAHIYYKDISVSENYIYALFLDLEIDEDGRAFSINSNQVHVFNWKGELIRRLFLEQGVEQISFNPIDKKLYGMNNEDEVFLFLID